MKESSPTPNPATASLPMLALDKFIEETGLSPVTVWRYRKKGWLACVNIAGRLYITREEIAKFNARAVAGEFSKEHVVPPPPTRIK